MNVSSAPSLSSMTTSTAQTDNNGNDGQINSTATTTNSQQHSTTPMTTTATPSRSSRNNLSGGSSSTTNLETIQKRVMKSVLEYNRQLNQERKEDRRVCMDLQTYTIQYPVGLGRENLGLRRWVKKRKRLSPIWRHGRRYPVALLPNQYQDWYLRYTAHELKYFPLNTVLHGPVVNDYDKLLLSSSNILQQQNNNQHNNTGNNSDSDMDGSDVLSDLDDDSTCSCGEIHCSPARKESIKSEHENEISNNNENGTTRNSNNTSFLVDENSCSPTSFASNGHNENSNSSTSFLNHSLNGASGKETKAVCRVCKLDVNKDEALICADCGVTSHPKCLEFHGELLEAIRLYQWQCQDCKSCNQCGQPHDEDKMMFCDKCDRGYHTYCVGLDHIPQGHWVCSLCAVCANCGTRKPSSLESTNTNSSITNPTSSLSSTTTTTAPQWQHELIKIHSPDGQTMVRHSVFCETCYQLRKL